MSTYKITNITNLLGKREINFNSVQDINYVDNMMRKTIKIKPTETIYLTIPSLPLPVQSLRAKKLITVVEITSSELNKIMNPVKSIHNVETSTTTVDDSDKEIAASNERKRNKKHEVKVD